MQDGIDRQINDMEPMLCHFLLDAASVKMWPTEQNRPNAGLQ